MRLVSTPQARGYRLAQAIRDEEGRVLVAAGAPLTAGLCDALVRRGVLRVLAEDGLTDDVAPVDTLLPQTRRLALQAAKAAFEHLQGGAPPSLQALTGVVDAILSDLSRAGEAALEFSVLQRVSDYTYTHSVNVCVYSVLLARELGYSPPDLRIVGIGSLLHDIGKILCADLCAKEGPLTSEEWVRMRKHPADGFNMLRRHHELHLFVAHMAFQHHERLDGSGYPRGLHAEQILPCARIVAVADVYDAMTADRPYARARTPADALRELARMADQGLDRDVVRALAERIARYPTGSLVLLSDDSIAVVTAQGSDPESPYVRRLASLQSHTILREPTPIPVQEPLRVTGTLPRLPLWLEEGLRSVRRTDDSVHPSPQRG